MVTTKKDDKVAPDKKPVGTTNMTLVAKLAQIMGEIKPVELDGENQHQNYKFQSEGAIKFAVKDKLAAQGVMIIPSYTVAAQWDAHTAGGKLAHVVDVMGTFTVTDGNETITTQFPGSGQDNGEKAMAKAYTSSQKYFLKQLFNISDKSESDPDADNSDFNAAPQQGQRSHKSGNRSGGNRQQGQRNSSQPAHANQNRNKAKNQNSDADTILKNASRRIKQISEITGEVEPDIYVRLLGQVGYTDQELQDVKKAAKFFNEVQQELKSLQGGNK
jgi:hypothetical protein